MDSNNNYCIRSVASITNINLGSNHTTRTFVQVHTDMINILLLNSEHSTIIESN